MISFIGSGRSLETDLLVTIAGIIDRDLSKSDTNDWSRNARNANDASTLIGSNVL